MDLIILYLLTALVIAVCLFMLHKVKSRPIIDHDVVNAVFRQSLPYQDPVRLRHRLESETVTDEDGVIYWKSSGIMINPTVFERANVSCPEAHRRAYERSKGRLTFNSAVVEEATRVIQRSQYEG